MKNSGNKTSEKTVEGWNYNAIAYDEILGKYQIFSTIANRIIDLGKVHLCKEIIDIAGGSGLISQMVLRLSHSTKIHFIEPAPQMMKLAQKRLDPMRTNFYLKKAEEVQQLNIKVDGIMSNAAMDIVNMEKVFKAISKVLKPGGIFAFNLWWYAFNETYQAQTSLDWQNAMEEALREYNEEVPEWSKSIQTNCYSREQLKMLASQEHLFLEKVIVDQNIVSNGFFIDFMSFGSSKNWPKDGLGNKRTKIINRAKNLLTDNYTTVSTTSFLLRKIN